MNIIQRPTKKFSSTSYKKDLIVIHITRGLMPETLNWLEYLGKNISAHYLVTKTGRIYQMVADDKMAWHAGRIYSPSALARKILKRDSNGFINPNLHSIGIEFEALDGQLWTESQMSAGVELIKKLGITTILTHYEITSYKPNITNWRDEILKLLKVPVKKEPVKKESDNKEKIVKLLDEIKNLL